MRDYSQEVREYAEIIWSTQFVMPVKPGTQLPPENAKDLAQGIVQITGASVGSVVLKMEPGLTERLTEKMFAIDQGKATQDEKRDAVSELTNQIGGNIKSIVDQPSNLSVPVVILDGKTPEFPNSKTVTDVGFECEDGKFWVSILAPQAENTPTASAS